MWEFLSTIFRETGILGLACIVEAAAVILIARMYKQKDARADQLQKDLLAMSEKRLEDVMEERQKYEELSQDLNKSINLLIQIFKKKAGLNGD